MSSVKVAVRVRPFNQRERDMNSKLILKMEGKKTLVTNLKVAPGEGELVRQRTKEFTFDYSYWSFSTKDPDFVPQEQVFSDLGKEVVENAFEGYNACVFAYGQTGSGKTYTMMGMPDSEGLIPRICQALFDKMKSRSNSGTTFRTEVSYLEIYNERVKDLLRKNSNQHNLRVREHPKLGPYVQDLSQHLAMDYSDVQELMMRGNTQRTTAATAMNDVSSRSHAIFTLSFTQASFNKDLPSETVSKVNLVDLAGSERADASGATGQRLKEGGHINKSLVTLGSVISALAESCSSTSNKLVFIPYRDSVLTWLLKDSLGGNSKTLMIATISPADCNYAETVSTLRYANRAKNIVNRPTINEDPNVKLIKELRSEIARLKSLLVDSIDRYPSMVEKLQKNEARVKVLTEEWTEKWKETHKILKEQRTLGLRKSGLGVILDSELPHLVGIDDDLLSTGITLYHLKEGKTRIGTSDAPVKQDIILNGVGISNEHCIVELENDQATLIPLGTAQCFLNTIQIDKPTRLSQGCVILLGLTNMFRYNDPAEVDRLRKEKERGSNFNLSRLSLLSKSASDLAKSLENLNCSGVDADAKPDSEWDKLEARRHQIEQLEESHRLAEEERQKRQQEAEEKARRKYEELQEMQRQTQLLLKQVNEGSAQLVASIHQQLENFNDEWSSLKQQEENVIQQIQKLKSDFPSDKTTKLNQLEDALKVAAKDISTLHARIIEHVQDLPEEYHQALLMSVLPEKSQRGDNLLMLLNQLEPDALCKHIEQVVKHRCQGTGNKWEDDVDGTTGPTWVDTWDAEGNQWQVLGRLQEDREKLLLATSRCQELGEAVAKEKNSLVEKHLEADELSDRLSKSDSGFDAAMQKLLKAKEMIQHRLKLVDRKRQQTSSDLDMMVRQLFSDNTRLQVSEPDSLPQDRFVTVPTLVSTIEAGSKSVTEVLLPQQSVLPKSDLEVQYKNLQTLENEFQTVQQDLEECNKDFERERMQELDQIEMEKFRLEEMEHQERINSLVEQEVRRQLLKEQLRRERQNLSFRDTKGLDGELARLREMHERELLYLQHKLNGHSSPSSSIDSDSFKAILQPGAVLSGDDCPVSITIPTYAMRGSGIDAHYEYEVKISVMCDTWTIYRRYKRFRELHQYMKLKYGNKTNLPFFPPRRIFGSRSERVVECRRKQLEIYLKELVRICTVIEGSPLFMTGQNLPTKADMYRFAPFFRKGCFETSKHGTG